MKKIPLIYVLLLLTLTTLLYVTWEKPTKVKAINKENQQLLEDISEPCSLMLEPVDKSMTNARCCINL